jgi:hypothetical protein
MGEEKRIARTYDRDRNGKLDKAERTLAREALKKERAAAPDRRRGPGGRRGGWGGNRSEPPKPGIAIKPEDVTPVAETIPLYELSALRTFFLEFEDGEWEAELGDFIGTDVEVPATLVVDGKRYADVGVSFRGASSLFMVGPGYKRSLNVSVDAVHPKQRLLGHKTLNLLNGHADPSFLDAVIVSHVARQYGPAPKVNLARVVINGENWGVYANAQQFDAIMLAEHFPSASGVRWKVPGSPRGRGGLEYFGSDLAEYEGRFELKAGSKAKAWKDLVALCKVLNETPVSDLEAKLAPILDVDGVLKFLAVEVVLANDDGYWTRASDYSLFEDLSGRFHLMPHDMNEAFGGGGMPFGPPDRRRGGGGGEPGDPGREPPPGPPPGAPRGGGDRGGGRFGPMHRGGPTLDPLIGLDDKEKPLRSRLLAVPALRKRYLGYVREVAATWLDWERLGPVVEKARELIEREVEIDTRKFGTLEEFRRITSGEPPAAESRPGPLSLRAFAEQRRRFLLEHAQIRALGADGGPGPGKDR